MTEKEPTIIETGAVDQPFEIYRAYTQRIGLKEYQIQLGGTLLDATGRRLMGRQHGDHQVIQLDSTWSPAGVVDTYIHECLHTMSGYAGSTLTEEEVSSIAAFMVAFIIDHGWATMDEMYQTILKGGPHATDIRDVSAVRKVRGSE